MADILKAVVRDGIFSFRSYADKCLNAPFQFDSMSAHASKAPFRTASLSVCTLNNKAIYYVRRCLYIYLLKNRCTRFEQRSFVFVLRQWLLNAHMSLRELFCSKITWAF